MSRTITPPRPVRAATVRERPYRSLTVAARFKNPSRKSRRWFGVAFGLLLGLAAVCHGCHLGDHDDELSVQSGAPKTQQHAAIKGAAP